MFLSGLFMGMSVYTITEVIDAYKSILIQIVLAPHPPCGGRVKLESSKSYTYIRFLPVQQHNGTRYTRTS